MDPSQPVDGASVPLEQHQQQQQQQQQLQQQQQYPFQQQQQQQQQPPPVRPAMPDILPMPGAPSAPLPNIPRQKRTRAKRSCDMCRKKKTKCNADQCRPCTPCRNANTRCEFLVEQKKRGPATGYVEALETRLKRMEQLIETMSQREQQQQQQQQTPNRDTDPNTSPAQSSNFVSSGTGSPQPAAASSPNSSSGGEGGASTVGDGSDSLDEKMSSLSLLTDYERTRYLGKSSGMHMLAQDVLDKQRHRVFENPHWILQKLNDEEEEHVFIKSEEITSPKRLLSHESVSLRRWDIFAGIPGMTLELSDFIIHSYFTYLHPFYPVINKIGFLEQFYFHNPTPPDECLVFAIFANSIRMMVAYNNFDEDINVDKQTLISLEPIFRQKAEKVMWRLHRRSRISTLQTLVLLTTYVEDCQDDSDDTKNWFIVGAAIRMAQDLGLHRSSSHWHIPEHEAELRRRLWYAVYSIDKWCAAELGRPVTILEDEVELELPSPYEIDSTHRLASREPAYQSAMPSLIVQAEACIREKAPIYTDFVEMLTLSRILGQVLSRLYSERRKPDLQRDLCALSELNITMANWKAGLPSALQYGSPEADFPGAGMINVIYNCVLILMHRPFVSKTSADNADIAFRALGTCTTAAVTIMDIVERLEREGFLCVPWNTITYSVFQSAVVFMHNAKCDMPYIKQQGIKNLARCARAYRMDSVLRKSRIGKILSSLTERFSLQVDEDDTYSPGEEPAMIEQSTGNVPSRKRSQHPTEGTQPKHVRRGPHVNVMQWTTSVPKGADDEPHALRDPATVAYVQSLGGTRVEDTYLAAISTATCASPRSHHNTPAMPTMRTSQMSSGTSTPIFPSLPCNQVHMSTQRPAGNMPVQPPQLSPVQDQQQQQPTPSVFTSTPSNIPMPAPSTFPSMDFDLNDLSSDLPLWSVPSSFTWDEWSAYLQGNPQHASQPEQTPPSAPQ